MHELPIARRIIAIASDAAARRGAARVSRIHIVLGEASGYLADAIAQYFDLISAGTPCAGAELAFEGVRAMLRCEDCGELFHRKPFSFTCPCGGQGTPTEIGREFYVKAIEVPDEPN